MFATTQAVRSLRYDSLQNRPSLRESADVARDEMRRCETVLESAESSGDVAALVKPLTARQLHAINLLAMGKSVVATAKSLEIGVSTLHRWKATHPLFRAELALRQHNLFDAMIQKLRLTMSKAVDHLFDMMHSNSRFERKEVMQQMLKLLKPERHLVPRAPMTVDGVLDERVREARLSRGASVYEEISEEERIAAIPSEFRVGAEEELEEDQRITPSTTGNAEAAATETADAKTPSDPDLRETQVPTSEQTDDTDAATNTVDPRPTHRTSSAVRSEDADRGQRDDQSAATCRASCPERPGEAERDSFSGDNDERPGENRG